jgi:hypothetical protein
MDVMTPEDICGLADVLIDALAAIGLILIGVIIGVIVGAAWL